MAKSRYIKEESLTFASGDNFTEAIDVSAHNGAFVQLVGPIGGAGTLTVQQSNDGTNWVDVGNATITTGKAGYVAINLYSQKIRTKVNLSGGAGSYNIYTMIKDQG